MTAPGRWVRRAAGGLAMLAAGTAASAACSVSAQAVAFGNYDPIGGSALDGTGIVDVTCDMLTSFSISLGPGNGTVADRHMTGGADQLHYNLYRDAARLFIWGEGLAGVSTIDTNAQLTVYGRIPGSQNVPANSYVDSVTVTVTY